MLMSLLTLTIVTLPQHFYCLSKYCGQAIAKANTRIIFSYEGFCIARLYISIFFFFEQRKTSLLCGQKRNVCASINHVITIHAAGREYLGKYFLGIRKCVYNRPLPLQFCPTHPPSILPALRSHMARFHNCRSDGLLLSISYPITLLLFLCEASL